MFGLMRCIDLEDRPRTWDLNQGRIGGIDKTGRFAGPAAGVPHRAVIDDIGALVRPEPHISGRLNPAFPLLNARALVSLVSGFFSRIRTRPA